MRVRRWFWLYVLPIVQMIAVAWAVSIPGEPPTDYWSGAFHLLPPPAWPAIALLNVPAWIAGWIVGALVPPLAGAATIIAAGALWHAVGRVRIMRDRRTPHRVILVVLDAVAIVGLVFSVAQLSAGLWFRGGPAGLGWFRAGIVVWTAWTWSALGRMQFRYPRWVLPTLHGATAAFIAEFVVVTIAHRAGLDWAPTWAALVVSALMVLVAAALAPRRLLPIGITLIVLDLVLAAHHMPELGYPEVRTPLALASFPVLVTALGWYLQRASPRTRSVERVGSAR